MKYSTVYLEGNVKKKNREANSFANGLLHAAKLSKFGLASKILTLDRPKKHNSNIVSHSNTRSFSYSCEQIALLHLTNHHGADTGRFLRLTVESVHFVWHIDSIALSL